nr:MAG TPA: hypothetical protein [Caudoviricetes sp.]
MSRVFCFKTIDILIFGAYYNSISSATSRRSFRRRLAMQGVFCFMK